MEKFLEHVEVLHQKREVVAVETRKAVKLDWKVGFVLLQKRLKHPKALLLFTTRNHQEKAGQKVHALTVAYIISYD